MADNREVRKPLLRLEHKHKGAIDRIHSEGAAAIFPKPRGKGPGLGLSISRSIVNEHGGDILLASEYGKGTTFSVLLPVLAAATA